MKKFFATAIALASIAAPILPAQAQTARYTSPAPSMPDFPHIRDATPVNLFGDPNIGSIDASREFVSLLTSDGNLHIQRIFVLRSASSEDALYEVVQADCGRGRFRENYVRYILANGNISNNEIPSDWKPFNTGVSFGRELVRECTIAASDRGIEYTWVQR
jgi:hypothetical protein